MTLNDTYQALQEFVAPAREKLPDRTWNYLMGGADTETTLLRNRQALDSLAFRPRVLRDVETVSARASLFGQDMRLPLILAPIGSLQDIVEGGGKAPARAAASFGVMHMLSSVCLPDMEEVAGATGGHPGLYQLYVRGDAAWIDERIDRAIAAGYAAFCFTVDLDAYGRRERDIVARYIATSRQRLHGEEYQSRFCWKDIERIRAKYRLPLIVKGIATAEDARIAVDHGIDAIYVSNHGGRQLDHGRGAIDILPEVVAAVDGKAAVLFDGGVMRGADVVKAMALGASAVGIGRLQGLAAGAAGEAGIVRMLEILETEILICLALLGVCGWEELDAGYLCRETPVRAPSPLGAFPLLGENSARGD